MISSYVLCASDFELPTLPRISMYIYMLCVYYKKQVAVQEKREYFLHKDCFDEEFLLTNIQK